MKPEYLAIIEELQKRLTALERVENVAFIQNLKRRTTGSASVQDGASTTGTSVSVRNAADLGSETVAEQYDGVLTLTDGQGATYRIGYYN